MTLKDFQVGDVLMATGRNRDGEREGEIEVIAVDFEGCGLVSYMGTGPKAIHGSGAFDPTKIGQKPFGFVVAVRKIGHREHVANARHWYPKPGDRGYDLMC